MTPESPPAERARGSVPPPQDSPVGGGRGARARLPGAGVGCNTGGRDPPVMKTGTLPQTLPAPTSRGTWPQPRLKEPRLKGPRPRGCSRGCGVGIAACGHLCRARGRRCFLSPPRNALSGWRLGAFSPRLSPGISCSCPNSRGGGGEVYKNRPPGLSGLGWRIKSHSYEFPEVTPPTPSVGVTPRFSLHELWKFSPFGLRLSLALL